MSHTIQQYWKDVRKLEETLPAVVWLVGTAVGAPPFVTEVASDVAAKMLHAKSHRVASEEEVAAQRTNDASAVKQAKQERMRRTGAAVVVVDEEPTSEPSPRRRR
ncbi:MAG: hypothetical protein ABIR70_22905 [Bryobacteraceae bacterium]